MSRGGIAWRRLSLGLNLVGFGVFLTLTTQGALPWAFWIEASRFWPVLLVALGLRVVFERTAFPWAVVLSPLLIHGTLALVALQPAPTLSEHWREVRAQREQDMARWTLDAELALARLDVSARNLPEDVLVRGRVAARDGHGELSVRERSAGPRVSLRHRGAGAHRWSRDERRWDLEVTRDLPLRVDLECALVHGRLDLTGAPLERLDVQGAFSDVEIALDTPDEDVPLDLDGAFNGYRLLVPPHVPVRVRADGALLDVAGRRDASRLEGPGYDVWLSGFASTLEVTVRDASDAPGGP